VGEWVKDCVAYPVRYIDPVKQWNRFARGSNAAVLKHNVGRPLDAGEAQIELVLKLRKPGMSLRASPRRRAWAC